jgi:hypothetical protein
VGRKKESRTLPEAIYSGPRKGMGPAKWGERRRAGATDIRGDREAELLAKISGFTLHLQGAILVNGKSRILRLLAIALILGLSVLGLATAPAGAAQHASTPFSTHTMASAAPTHPSKPKDTFPLELANYKSGLCLGIKGGGTGNEPAVIWRCTGTPDQGWAFVKAGRYWKMQDLHGRCLGIKGGSKAQGENAIQWRCENVANQEWHQIIVINEPNAPVYELQNVNSGRCLAVNRGGTTAGDYVVQWSCIHHTDQYWFLQVPNP